MPGFLDYLQPPPMPGLLQSGINGQPFYPSAPNWGEQRDPFVFGAPRPPPAGDVVLPTARPGFADTMPRIPQSLHRNDARLFGGDFIPAAWQGGPGDGLPEAVRRSIAEQPSYGEGEVSPPLASRRAGYDAYGAETEAMRGQPGREQDLREALAMRGYGSTIPTVEAQENSMYGQPISDTQMSQMRQWWQENYPEKQQQGLPEAVRRSIAEQPSYAEGEVMAPSLYYNPAFNEEPWRAPTSPEKRENYLSYDRGHAIGTPDPNPEDDPRFHALPEGSVWTPRPPEVSPFASPLDPRLQRRGPFALY